MLKNVKSIALSALIGLGAISAVPSAANAGGVGIEIGGPGFGFYFGDERRGRHWDGRRDGRHWDRPRHDRHFCTPDRAVRKASRMGVRHARVGHVNRHSIGVRGRQYGHRTYVVFARAPRCPVIR